MRPGPAACRPRPCRRSAAPSGGRAQRRRRGGRSTARASASPPTSRPSRRRRSQTTASTDSAIGSSAASGWWAFRRSPMSTCAIAPAPGSVEHVEQHRHLDAVAGGEGDPLEHLARGGDLAGQWLPYVRQLGKERRQQRPGGEAADPSPALGISTPPAVKGRRVGALHEPRRPPRRAAGPGGPSRSARRSAGVGVHVDHELPPNAAERAPHGVALTQHGPSSGVEVGLLARPRAPARAGDLCRCRPPRPRPPPAAGPPALRGQGSALTMGSIVAATSRAGSTTDTVAVLRSSSSSSG